MLTAKFCGRLKRGGNGEDANEQDEKTYLGAGGVGANRGGGRGAGTEGGAAGPGEDVREAGREDSDAGRGEAVHGDLHAARHTGTLAHFAAADSLRRFR